MGTAVAPQIQKIDEKFNKLNRWGKRLLKTKEFQDLVWLLRQV